jgi:hypothetical protein
LAQVVLVVTEPLFQLEDTAEFLLALETPLLLLAVVEVQQHPNQCLVETAAAQAAVLLILVLVVLDLQVKEIMVELEMFQDAVLAAAEPHKLEQ